MNQTKQKQWDKIADLQVIIDALLRAMDDAMSRREYKALAEELKKKKIQQTKWMRKVEE